MSPRSSRIGDAIAAAQVLPIVPVRSIDRSFDYVVPDALRTSTVVGSLVACPFGGRPVLGVVTGLGHPTHDGALSAIAGVVNAPPVPEDLIALAGWVSRYYRAPLGACVRLVLPPGTDGVLRRRADGTFLLADPPGAGRIVTTVRLGPSAGVARGRRAEIRDVLSRHGGALPAAELVRRAKTTMVTLRAMARTDVLEIGVGESDGGAPWIPETAHAAATPPELTAEQGVAVARIGEALSGGERAMLLHGVTGSGKTEVYIRAIREVTARGRTSLLLVPEIALTPQSFRRLRGRLGDRVAIWHSGLGRAERVREDRRIRSGDVDVVVGARSAVFAPLANVGLIIVDEEHESSYKQDQSPRYDARQVAVRRARDARALVIFGSATPRPESWHSLRRLTLGARADGAPLPRVELVDMRLQPAGPLSRPLTLALQHAVGDGAKAIVLLNRRGFARLALCRSCGWIGRCPNCDVALVLHRPGDTLACHHCGWERRLPNACPECAATDIARQGVGTQGLERALRDALPGARLVRLDGDRTSGRGAIARLLDEFAAAGPAVLFGTQMVAKGHDIPGIAVAGVLDADGPLQYPDFRAEERAFGLVVQLAGRAGRRRGERSRVIVQAWEPGARALQLAAAHDVVGFLDGEIARRRAHGNPPFGHLVRAVVEGADERVVVRAAARLAEVVRDDVPDCTVLGPSRLHRLRGRHRRALLARGPRAGPIATALDAGSLALARVLRDGSARVLIDVDPQET